VSGIDAAGAGAVPGEEREHESGWETDGPDGVADDVMQVVEAEPTEKKVKKKRERDMDDGAEIIKKKEKREKRDKVRKLKVSEDTEAKTSRPRKRRKIEGGEQEDGAAIDGQDGGEKVVASPPQRRTPTPPPPSVLPSFPLPTRPDAPAKAELASQGLDRALAHAQLVDPALSTPLPSGTEDDAGTGLSLKTRARLAELGITELFAGASSLSAAGTEIQPSLTRADGLVQTTLLPLLLPSDPLQRSLYLPYDPPRDICVSAPTGSGKTLAYVLPIVEVGCRTGAWTLWLTVFSPIRRCRRGL